MNILFLGDWNNVLFWGPKCQKWKQQRPSKTYVYQLRKNTCLRSEELIKIMRDREEWKKQVNGAWFCSK